jgi:hypothetical protein
VALRSEESNWHHGSSAADVGTKEWADFVRLQLVSMVEHLGENEESFLGYVELIREHRAWTLMTRKDGTAFKTIEEFCSERRPWGLGTTWQKLRPFLVSGMAKRGKSPDEIERSLQLETVPEAEQGKRMDLTSSHDDKKSAPPATVARLRAITRAPDAVKDAYREGRISQTLAAKLGPKNPTPEQAAKVAEVAQSVRKIRDRKQVDAEVRRALGHSTPTLVAQAFRLVERMTPAERLDFDRQIRPLIAAAEVS